MNMKNLDIPIEAFTKGGNIIVTDVAPDYVYKDGVRDMTKVIGLAHRKKDPAPGVLVDMITSATATVKDPATFEALYMHLDAVYSYLLDD